jgi:hypothetical protein
MAIGSGISVLDLVQMVEGAGSRGRFDMLAKISF